ncbi:MAG: methyltransferase domain-containing protein [Planctomycetes bacterium]|nr:methyltransferase domain-containing protein [Planctomycetota bacterium]
MPWNRLSRAARQRRGWDAGLSGENEFWTRWLQGRGLTESEDYRRRIDATTEILEHLKPLIEAPVGSRVDVLDVGAGPLTAVGAVWPGCELRVTAVDPLAVQYNQSLDRLGIIPPVRTQFGEAEHLLDQFQPESFDLVYSRNALDHSYDPMLGVSNMFALARVGGVVRLEHSVNEGRNQRYRGLHQWNFDVQEGRFVIWNKAKHIYVDKVLPPQARITCEKHDPARSGMPHWLNVTIMKTCQVRSELPQQRPMRQ